MNEYQRIPEIDTLVAPFYLRFLKGNFLRDQEMPCLEFIASIRSVVPLINADAISRMLEARGWRERLSAAWFIGLLKIEGFEARISDLLIRSETCFAGQGYCFALARYGTTSSAQTLQAYLSTYLPVGDRIYDQEWALGALHHLDAGAALSVPKDSNAWHPLDPSRGIENFQTLMQRLDAVWTH